MHILSCSIVLLAASAAAQQIVLPRPSGPHNVTVRTSELIDSSRIDPFGNGKDNRRLMVSVYSPTSLDTTPCLTPYMPPKVAAYLSEFYASAPPPLNFTADFSRIVQPVCSVDVTYGLPTTSQRQNSTSEFPLIVFGHAYSVTRMFYNIMLESLASYGYIVASIDHPYDSQIIEYPDGSTILNPNATVGNEENRLARTSDVIFVLDQLSSNCTLQKLIFPADSYPTSFEEVGIWGHSLGGATAASAILVDDRFKGGSNIDGSLWDDARAEGLSKPFIFFQEDKGNDDKDLSWVDVWPRLTGLKRVLRIAGSKHAGMLDAKLLLDLVGAELPFFGSIDGVRQIEILVNYMVDFFGFLLQGKDLGLVEAPSEDYPDVTFVDMD